MKRRDFITLIGGAAAAWPHAARAQQQAIPTIGFLGSTSPAPAPRIAAFHSGLNESGYVVGQNVAIEYRWADDHYDRLPALATDLIRRQVAVIVAAGGPASALAAKTATTTIPVVFTAVSDPVKSGLVASMNRPGGNVTGVAALTIELDAKRLELLREIAPAARDIAALVNPNRPDTVQQLSGIQTAVQSVGHRLLILKAGNEHELDAVFDTQGKQFDALLVGADPFFLSRSGQLLALLARHGRPAIFAQREFVVAGGIISYGTSLTDAYRQAGVYTGQILKGDKPANLPVVQPTKFELVINLKAAKVLGLTVPQTLQVAADEVIE
jgi:putative ABC transport system substrate-binding protein